MSFAEFVTRFGEAGVYGFLPHLKNRAVAQNLLQSITTEAKQEVSKACEKEKFTDLCVCRWQWLRWKVTSLNHIGEQIFTSQTI